MCRLLPLSFFLFMSIVIIAQQSEIIYNSDNTSPQLLLTEADDPGNQANQDGWARIWFQNNTNLNDRWAMLARPHAGATDNVGALNQPLIFAHNSNQILGLSPDGSVRINKAYKLPKTVGTQGQVMTSNGSGNTTWETPADDGIPTNGIILSADIDPNIEAAGYSYFGRSQQENFETFTTQDTVQFPYNFNGLVYTAWIWGDDKCFLFGGTDSSNGNQYHNNGFYFDAVTESFVTMTSTGAPSPRSNAQIFWTGSKLVVLGGSDGSGPLNTGGIYDPALDSWTSTSTSNAPAFISYSIITNSRNEIIKIGYWDGSGNWETGAIYDLASDTWTTMSSTNHPSWRTNYVFKMIDDKLVVYGGKVGGGNSYINTGSVFNPSTNSWSTMTATNAPQAGSFPTALDLDTKMMIWGANENVEGAIYDLVSDTWTTMSVTNAPSSRQLPANVWTGTEVILIGGYGSNTSLKDGAKYNPVTDTWTTINANPDLEDGNNQNSWGWNNFFWTGTQLWLRGAIYDNTNDSFTPRLDLLTFSNYPLKPNGAEVNGEVYNLGGGFAKFCMACGDGTNVLSYEKVMHMYIKD